MQPSVDADEFTDDESEDEDQYLCPALNPKPDTSLSQSVDITQTEALLTDLHEELGPELADYQQTIDAEGLEGVIAALDSNDVASQLEDLLSADKDLDASYANDPAWNDILQSQAGEPVTGTQVAITDHCPLVGRASGRVDVSQSTESSQIPLSQRTRDTMTLRRWHDINVAKLRADEQQRASKPFTSSQLARADFLTAAESISLISKFPHHDGPGSFSPLPPMVAVVPNKDMRNAKVGWPFSSSVFQAIQKSNTVRSHVSIPTQLLTTSSTCALFSQLDGPGDLPGKKLTFSAGEAKVCEFCFIAFRLPLPLLIS